jgi:anthranilate synthase component I
MVLRLRLLGWHPERGVEMFKPTLREFEALAHKGYNLIPVAREIPADLETPVSAFLKVTRGDYSFLLESVRGGEKWGRYTFLGTEPSMVVRARGSQFELIQPSSAGQQGYARIESRQVDNCFDALRREVQRFRAPELPELPRFFGGAVGFLAYDLVRLFEPKIPNSVRDDVGVPELYLMFTDTVLVFDNVRQTLKIIANVALDGSGSVESGYRKGQEKIERTINRLRNPASLPSLQAWRSNQSHSLGGVQGCPKTRDGVNIAIASNMTREDYVAMVAAAKEYIAAGDIIQVVPSQRFEAPLTVHPFNLYRSLRTINPSPYMFYPAR